MAGGGSDYPPFVAEHGGFTVTAAINKYVYVAINSIPNADYNLRYSETEHVTDVDSIKHALMREAIRYYDVPLGTEIVSTADLPSGCGLGSSGAFAVSLCHALSRYVGREPDAHELAVDAAHVELAMAQRGGGTQDHFSTALGDVQILEFLPSGRVLNSPLDMTDLNWCALQDRLHLYFTGHSRDADAILRTQTSEGLAEIKASGEEAAHLLECGDLDGFGELLNVHWLAKQQRSPHISNPDIDRAYEVALANGATGGKLVGAGGGGYILCYARDGERLTAAMDSIGMSELPFQFDALGTTLLCNV